jgi:lipid-A-disaccharide synthase
MSGLRTLALDRVTFSGIGGPAMEAEGLKSLFSIDATSVMGLYEIVGRIPEIFQRIRAASNYANATQPDALVCIDSPEFTHRIARRVRRLAPGIRTVSYVAPQVWASRSYRAKNMSRYFDLVLALLPFEVPFLKSHGVNAQFVGHPVVERAASVFGGEALRKRLGISPSGKILLTLPGSRISEVRPLLPIFRAGAAIVAHLPRHIGDRSPVCSRCRVRASNFAACC